MDKPDWCSHKDCNLKVNSQNMVCLGKLSEPLPHNGDFNTHRFCLDTRETGHGIFDLQINWSDAWNFIRILKLVKERK